MKDCLSCSSSNPDGQIHCRVRNGIFFSNIISRQVEEHISEIVCSGCKREVSQSGLVCPHCGFSIQDSLNDTLIRHRGNEMITKTYSIGELKKYKYVVVLSFYNGKILLSRHNERLTWETQGGHIEENETPLEAAKRELFEESGAIEYSIAPVCDYWSGTEDMTHGANGMVFKAIINKLGQIPESEIAEVRQFYALPGNLTYPAITPVLFDFLTQSGN